MDPHSDNRPAGGDTPKDPGRRWLLKSGAAAGPLVLTLRGGGGWVGSGTQCNVDKWGNKKSFDKLSKACKTSLGIITKK